MLRVGLVDETTGSFSGCSMDGPVGGGAKCTARAARSAGHGRGLVDRGVRLRGSYSWLRACSPIRRTGSTRWSVGVHGEDPPVGATGALGSGSTPGRRSSRCEIDQVVSSHTSTSVSGQYNWPATQLAESAADAGGYSRLTRCCTASALSLGACLRPSHNRVRRLRAGGPRRAGRYVGLSLSKRFQRARRAGSGGGGAAHRAGSGGVCAAWSSPTGDAAGAARRAHPRHSAGSVAVRVAGQPATVLRVRAAGAGARRPRVTPRRPGRRDSGEAVAATCALRWSASTSRSHLTVAPRGSTVGVPGHRQQRGPAEATGSSRRRTRPDGLRGAPVP